MPGPFHGINMASGALRAFQRAMETHGNNLANVNTRGYSRQRVDFQPNEPMSLWSGGYFQLGNGVRIDSITRAREMFLENRFQSAAGDWSRFNTYTNGLQQLEGLYREPGEAGIGHALDKMFDAFSGLASNPSDTTARTRVRDAATLLATRVRTTHRELNTLREQMTVDVQSTISQINTMAEQIATLNAQIRGASASGGTPNTLLDQRDVLMRDLSQLANVTVAQQSDGTMNVYVTNFPLVVGDQARPFPTTFDPATMTVTDAGGQSFPVRGGELAGRMQAIARVDRALTDLDSFANQLRTQFNSLHQTGLNALGQTGINFFNDVAPGNPQTGAVDFNLNPAILSDLRALATGTTNAPGDGGLALAMSNLRNTSVAALGNRSVGQFYRDMVSGLANEIGQGEAQTETFASVLQQIEAQSEAISGVNLDEEMTDLMRFQRSYQAAARVLTIMDQTTEDIINMVRR